ncbi:MAG TPA: EAL domain-containing protein [Solirubrobacteraceae bacterium]|jgi:diguanylate cyclase (GGDEF)-like protein|nr:EAL domain-containing protein [Solirubrobacteraceae bacterium]
MKPQRSSSESKEIRVPLPPSAVVGESGEDVRRLGEALRARTEDVLERTVAHTAGSGHEVDAVVQGSFERISRSSTIAVARWMEGEGMAVAIEAGQETWEIFGELAAHRAAPLNEVTWRCFWWRNVMAEVLRESAAQLEVSTEALSEAMHILQLSLEFSLLRMCECFEKERQRTDEELTRREEELSFLATHDPLTGLPNRTLILDRVEQMLARSRRNQTPTAALFVDLDNFKSINDTLGHAAGDELLQAVAARLDGVIRGADTLGRLGGDEFVVISEHLSLAAGPELIAERLLEALKHPFKLGEDGEHRLTVTASIGIAVGDRVSPDELLRDADIAMYRAKWDGKNRHVVFEASMQDTVQNRMELEMDLREALQNGEFVLAYQPTLALSDMTPNGVEALIRWRHPVRGLVQPNDFIPLLEETGLITEVGRWVLKEACRQGAAWRAEGHPISMAVNVSGRQLDTDRLILDIEEALSQSGLDAGALTIEITETTLMRNIEETARRLAAIKQLGVRIAIDDFGTGYSSLAHLQRFPVDALKIDRSFISGLKNNKEGETLIHTLVQLGKALSIETFAEGIEQQQELALLQGEQCDSGQGFLFARPLDPAETETFLRELRQQATSALAPAPPRT